MHSRLISPLCPAADETLMSFLSRAQNDAEYTDERLHLLAAGVHLQNARAAERRSFDWNSLARFFNASPEELFQLSERSWLFGPGEITPRSRGHAPWSREPGYGAHCPCCLKESEHWRKAWLKPNALVCTRHETLLVRHCPFCDQRLAGLNWSRALPLCPTCGSHLSLGSKITAPTVIIEESVRWADRFEFIITSGPLIKQDEQVAHWAAGWCAAQVLVNEENSTMGELAATLVDLSNLGTLAKGDAPDQRALRFAQVSLATHRMDELHRSLSEHYWLTMKERVSQSELDKVVRYELLDLAETLGLPVTWDIRCQTALSSNAGVCGWNLLPIAA